MGLIKQLCSYSIGNVMILLAGFISFPVFTRMLSPADYGLMSLINLTSALCITFCKGGLQQALIREWDINKGENIVVVSTALFGSMIITAGVFVVFGMAASVASYIYNDQAYLLVFLITSGLVVSETVKSIFYNKIRAMQQTVKYNYLTIIAKYSQILIAIVFMFAIGRTAYILLAGFIVASVLMILWMLYSEREVISLSHFEYSKFKGMLTFGFPLIFYELTNQGLNFVDRYFIGFYKGAEAVGKYSAAYNLTFYIQSLLVTTVSLTIYPMIVEKLNDGGYAAANVFIKECLLWFCLVGSACTLGFAALGADIFILTATAKYSEAASIITPLICGGFLYGIFTIAVGELFVKKSTKRMAIIMGLAAIMNIVLNIIFIPYWGLLGAAYATLVPEILLAVVGLWKLGIFTDTRQMLLMIYYSVPSLIMYLALIMMNNQTTWASISERIAVAFIIWILFTIVLNTKARNELFTRCCNIKS